MQCWGEDMYGIQVLGQGGCSIGEPGFWGVPNCNGPRHPSGTLRCPRCLGGSLCI